LTEEQRSQLSHVVTPPGELDISKFPDFMLLGPPRTGTTWMHQNLTRHPNIFMTEPKELYYFSSVQWPHGHSPRLPEMSPDLAWYLQFFEESEEARAGRQAQCQRDFGVDYNPLIRGEASASYAAACQERVIRDILTLNPKIKAVILVRHPLERAWSHVKKEMSLDRRMPADEIGRKECESFLAKSPFEARCSMFSEYIELWRRLLPEGQLFIGDFRDIRSKPADLLCRLFRFLGVDDDPRWVGKLANVRICYTAPRPLPSAVRPVFEDLYREEFERLAELGFEW
jgi:hypothetical protein